MSNSSLHMYNYRSVCVCTLSVFIKVIILKAVVISVVIVIVNSIIISAFGASVPFAVIGGRFARELSVCFATTINATEFVCATPVCSPVQLISLSVGLVDKIISIASVLFWAIVHFQFCGCPFVTNTPIY